jgi:predicted Fe-S protein YdhL (DUF1289 family)
MTPCHLCDIEVSALREGCRRSRKPARLWLRPASKDREAVWIILDGGEQFSTSCRRDDREAAERALGLHLAQNFLQEKPVKHRAAAEAQP